MAESGDPYRFSWESVHGTRVQLPEGGPWVFVNGGGLPCEIALRIHRHPDGRYAFSGIVVADALPAPMEISTQVLRRIRLGEIQAGLFGASGVLADFDPARPPADGSTPTAEAVRWMAELAYAHGQAAEGKPRAAPDAELRAFARAYQLELARQPHRAMTAAARTSGISRATANRWAAQCRQRGYLASASPGKDSP